jgi:hypothetical protein
MVSLVCKLIEGYDKSKFHFSKLLNLGLKGAIGDKINALLCGVGHNLRLIARHFMPQFGY